MLIFYETRYGLKIRCKVFLRCTMINYMSNPPLGYDMFSGGNRHSSPFDLHGLTGMMLFGRSAQHIFNYGVRLTERQRVHMKLDPRVHVGREMDGYNA